MERKAADALLAARTAAEFLAVWLRHPLLSAASQKVVDDYYGNFRGLASARMRHWYDEQLREAQQFVRPGCRVLEIGVGSGTEFLWWALQGASVVGIDAFPHCTETTRERLQVLERLTGRALDAEVRQVPIHAFDDREGFDLIWMEQSFHHLEPREEVVRKISSLLRGGGRVVLSEANALNPLLQLQLLRARGLRMYIEVETEAGTVIYGNERVLSRGMLARRLRRVGIEQESARYYRVFPSHPFFENFFAIERSITSQWLAPVYTHYNFVGRKAA